MINIFLSQRSKRVEYYIKFIVVIINNNDSNGILLIILYIFHILIVLVAAGLTMAVLSSCCEPHTRGFFCNDLSLRHPYKESTIQNWMLYLMCVVLPISTVNSR